MSDYRDLDWKMFTGYMFSKKELDEIYQQGRADERQQGLAGKILAEVRSVVQLYHIGDYLDDELAEDCMAKVEDICLKYMED